MAQPLPGLNEFCVNISTGTGELCVQLPGNTTICASVGVNTGDTAEITRGMFAQINSALAPLTPIFNIVEFAKAVADCMSALPDAINNLDPSAITDCIPGLQQRLANLLNLLPQASVPILAKTILDVLIQGLIGIRSELLALQAEQERIIAAATRAAMLGNTHLQVVVDCASGNLDAQLVNISSSALPLNRLILTLNILLDLAGLPCVPAIPSPDSLDDSVIEALNVSIQVLQQIRALIPAPDLILPAIPSPSDPCD